MSVLIDTDVLINHLRGVEKARDLLLQLVGAGDPPAVSVITVAEIEAGIRAIEREQVGRLLDGLVKIPVDDRIARKAGEFRRQYGSSHGVLLPDALIAATAAQAGRTLYTLNTKHYPMSGLQVLTAY